MQNVIMVQGIGAIAYILLALSYFRKEKANILLTQIFAYTFFSVYYYLLSGVTGAVCNVIGLVALATIYLIEKYTTKKKSTLLITLVTIFAGLLLVANIITYSGIFSILPMIASVSVIISFLSNKENTIRCVGILSAVCWLIFTIVFKSYIGIIYETVTFAGVVVAFLIHHNGNKNLESK